MVETSEEELLLPSSQHKNKGSYKPRDVQTCNMELQNRVGALLYQITMHHKKTTVPCITIAVRLIKSFTHF